MSANYPCSMRPNIPIQIAYEDDVSEAVLKRLVDLSDGRLLIANRIHGRGFGRLKRMANGLNQAAKGMPCILLTDLDQCECAPILISEWVTQPQNSNFLFRVAVREVESWILADRAGFAQFLKISEKHIPSKPDLEEDAKRCLVNCARKSRQRALREDLAPVSGSTAKQGPNYNARLIEFISNDWNVAVAAKNSESLNRAYQSIINFCPS